ncbi:MAG: trypsin, partial [Bacteroidales bacterium]|nr:trypsin [Bacteroidales bacterium]
MKSIISSLTFLIVLLSVSEITGQYGPSPEDKTLSPYFFIQSDDPETDRLPLKSTKADVNIAGVIADVTITQVYINEGKYPIEAVYVFPASTRAAVYAMSMIIGERVIIARVEERDKARQQYEQAKNNGQNASLLEQERPNVFTMNVANIMPGDQVRIELKYTEILVPVDRVY